MRRTAGLVLAAAALLGVGASAPYDPVERAAAALRERPVYVDPDLGYLLTPEDRTKVEDGLRKLDAPVFLAVLPGVPQGYINAPRNRLLAERTGRDGAYILVTDRGCFGVNTQTLPKKDPLEIPQQCEATSAAIRDLTLDYARAADRLADAPPGKLSGPTTWNEPASDDGTDESASEHPDDRLSLGDWARISAVLIPGALVGAYVLRPLVLLVVRLVRRRPQPTRKARRAMAELDARLEGVR
ncbi:hypothetical protein OHS70_15505 [Streptomyces sp. NBC_00390]|uniref:hypothetical protein n=1 Tax=Streptomyces sp. NBC_00390 TaxID=2975736 RepID=UPI002E24B908